MSLRGTLRSPLTSVYISARSVQIWKQRWSSSRSFSALSSFRQQEQAAPTAEPNVSGAYNYNNFTPAESAEDVPFNENPPQERAASSGASEIPEVPETASVRRLKTVETGESGLQTARAIKFDFGVKLFDNIFLRDSCQCHLCVDPSSRQKLFQTSDIPSNIVARQTRVSEDGSSVLFQWANDIPHYREHTTTLPISFLRNPAGTLHDEAFFSPGIEGRKLWNRQKMMLDNRFINYKDYMQDDEVLYDTLRRLNVYGLVFLDGCPDSEQGVEHIISRIGTLRDTFYGRTWDVKSKPDAKNIAYTHQFLGMHMDLLYMTNPPHLQLLHSLRARAPGGASMFSDSFAAATKLQLSQPDLFSALASYPINYHYHNDGYHYRSTRPTIELSPAGTIRRVNWSPPFQAPLTDSIHPDAFPDPEQSPLRKYLAAAKIFQTYVEESSSIFEHRLAEGQCVIFDNRRVLHARRAFDATKGERWLKGAYVDDDVFFSKLRVLREKLGTAGPSDVAKGVVRKHLGRFQPEGAEAEAPQDVVKNTATAANQRGSVLRKLGSGSPLVKKQSSKVPLVKKQFMDFGPTTEQAAESALIKKEYVDSGPAAKQSTEAPTITKQLRNFTTIRKQFTARDGVPLVRRMP